jgi:hypothetical protein
MAIGPGAMASNMKSAHEWPKFPPLMSQIIGIIGVGSVISGLLLANDMHMRAAIAGCAGSGNNLGVLDFCDAGIHLNSQDLLEHIAENNLTPS